MEYCLRTRTRLDKGSPVLRTSASRGSLRAVRLAGGMSACPRWTGLLLVIAILGETTRAAGPSEGDEFVAHNFLRAREAESDGLHAAASPAEPPAAGVSLIEVRRLQCAALPGERPVPRAQRAVVETASMCGASPRARAVCSDPPRPRPECQRHLLSVAAPSPRRWHTMRPRPKELGPI